MKASGLGTAPRKLPEEMKEVKSIDVLLPTRDKQIRLRVVSKELKVLLQRMTVLLPGNDGLCRTSHGATTRFMVKTLAWKSW
jgi:hypothetical protein